MRDNSMKYVYAGLITTHNAFIMPCPTVKWAAVAELL